MMMINRKGMTMALGVIIAIVVLIVVALAVIAITTGSLSNLFATTSDQDNINAARIKCNSWFTNWCLTNPHGDLSGATYPTVTIGDQSHSCDDLLGSKTCGSVGTGTGTGT